MYRTSLLGKLSREDEGKKVILSGWADTIRDHGGLIFIDLRDSSGKSQIVVDPSLHNAKNIRSEFVIRVEGTIKLRDRDMINPNISTGEIEVVCEKIDILNESLPLPFEVDDSTINETLKYKYRFLSMRNPEVAKKIQMRSQLMKITREFFHNNSFTEVDTPILTKSTPEGARDFLVPSRINPGSFYALPQSPQLFKQMLIIGGVDRYFQICKCFRDEDLRADRQPEFLQLDVEMAFVEQEEIMKLSEQYISKVLSEFANYKIDSIPKMKYSEALAKYGSDKPDTSFGMLIEDLSDIAERCKFKVFNDCVKRGGKVRALKLENQEISRKDIDTLTEQVSKYGAKGLAWIKVTSEGLSSVIAKFFEERELEEIVSRMDAKAGDTIFFVADEESIVCDSLGFLRLELAKRYDLKAKGFHLLWVVDFPMFEYVDGRYKAIHHPFTSSVDGISKAYDLVINGSEIGGGSIRIHNLQEQLDVFNKLGMSNEEAEEKFSHILNALRYGAPPHGGIAFGFSRMLAILLEEESIREVIPFPKTQRGICLTTDAPSNIDSTTLLELHIKKVEKAK